MFVHILPEEVRRLISAGEVIESPADCVKELLENSLDAKAKRVEVEMVKGGKRYISVKDDGLGIHPEDMDRVILEYATSKIRSAEDLSSLQTYGFRGEALSSIAKVSRMVISSRFYTQDKGTGIRVEGGIIRDKRTVGMPVGTRVEVFDLFYNLPARLKFLKSEETERNRVIKTFKEYAIARPDVHLVLVSNGRELFNLPPAEDIRERLSQVFEQPFEEFCHEDPPIRVRLFLSVQSSRGEVHVFLNSRPVYNRNLSEFVRKTAGYKKVAVCLVELPPYMVDFNIHPKKREVKIYKERRLLQTISGILKKPTTLSILKQQTEGYKLEPKLVGILDNTVAIARIGDFLYFFDVHLLSERLGYEMGMDEDRACRLAYKAGDSRLEEEKVLELLRAWMDFSNPEVCPHGRPIYYRVYIGDIYKKLGRSF